MVSCVILSYHDKKEDPTLELFKFEGPFKSERYFFLLGSWGSSKSLNLLDLRFEKGMAKSLKFGFPNKLKKGQSFFCDKIL
jgi:hypothetical protein